MIYVAFDHEGELVAHTAGSRTYTDVYRMAGAHGFVTCGRDCQNIYAAKHLAERMTEYTGDKYIPIDRGDYIRPRFDIMEAPKVGHEVSKGFNGDYYPCGEIVRISPSMARIETSDGTVFTRRKMAGASVKHSSVWKVANSGAFALVRGHINKRNPHF